MSRSPKQTDKRVAQDGVAKVPDVRRLVRIDAGVLDENLAFDVGSSFTFVTRTIALVPLASDLRSLFALKACIDVASAGHFELREALGQRHGGDNLFGDLARCLAKLLRQLKRKRHGKLAHLDLGRRINHDVLKFDLVLLVEEFAYMLSQLFLSFQVHDDSGKLAARWPLFTGIARREVARKSLRKKPIITNASIDAGLTLMAPLPMMKVPTTQ